MLGIRHIARHIPVAVCTQTCNQLRTIVKTNEFKVQFSIYSKLPALAFYTKYRTLIVTEINSNSPLSRFSLEKFLTKRTVQKNEVGKLAWTTDINALVKIVLTIYCGSWEVSSKSRHSVLMFDGTSVKLEVSRSNDLEHYRSRSVGGG